MLLLVRSAGGIAYSAYPVCIAVSNFRGGSTSNQHVVTALQEDGICAVWTARVTQLPAYLGTCAYRSSYEMKVVPALPGGEFEQAAAAVCCLCWVVFSADVLKFPSLGLSYRRHAAEQAHKHT
jgi:hypothetical protein